MRYSLLLFIVLFLAVSVRAQELRGKSKKYKYEEVNLEDMMRRYFAKESSHPIEGIYTVSCVITENRKAFLSQNEKSKVVVRKDNYARVAILKDWAGTKREFIEISLSYRDPKRYPVMGEISTLSEGKGLIYNHIEPDGSVVSFSMIGESGDLLEGEYSIMTNRKRITYKLSYLKIYPKVADSGSIGFYN